MKPLQFLFCPIVYLLRAIFTRSESKTQSVLFDLARTTSYTLHKLAQRRQPSLYFGYTNTIATGPGSTTGFLAVILKRVKAGHGSVQRVPTKVAIFETRREAADASLIWLAEHAGLPTKNLKAGSLTREDRASILSQVRGSKKKTRIPGPTGTIIPTGEELKALNGEPAPAGMVLKATPMPTPTREERLDNTEAPDTATPDTKEEASERPAYAWAQALHKILTGKRNKKS